jgi:Zn-dependent M28 family amino/carboxypeptidase
MKRAALVLVAVCGLSATEPNAATKRWWRHVVALSGDDLQGRDTGSEGYRKAAAYVVKEFAAAGLKPAGESGDWYQSVPMRKVKLRTDQSSAELVASDGKVKKLEWLRQITAPARAGAPESVDMPLVFGETVRIGRGGAPGGGRVTIDATGGPEPARWPVQYSVAVSLAEGTAAPQKGGGALTFRFNPAAAEMLFEGSGHTYKEMTDLAAAGKPLPKFDLAYRLRARMKFETEELRSDNILGVLPGSDPEMAKEYVVIAAHLDGYGVGEPWGQDNIYNGAFDDAAYVATLIDFAQQLRASGTRLKRSVFFGVWTGEEKGLLGSRWFVAHPTVPKSAMVANVNLDQLRPIFPLKTLTTLAVDESSLGETVRRVAGEMRIRIQPDPEPERNLLRRSDHWNFMGIGVPAAAFIFGYEKGTPEEAIYREWYAVRYHSPKDDLQQPWVPDAAAKFNDFFARLVKDVANASERPAWKAGSQYAPK